MNDNWHKRFLDLAEHVSTWSKDPRTQVGAVIVDSKKRVVGLGYNGFPRGVNDDQARYRDRPTKHLYVSHAERNALDNCYFSVESCSLYVTMLPCNECCKSIIQRGITKVYTYPLNSETIDCYHWVETIKMFQESGVELHYI